jgi:hypothetical protein
MQTFLPFPDFMESAKVLDKKRCWKQVVEAKQIINILEKIEFSNKQFSEFPESLRFREVLPWANHPAVKMWVGYIPALRHYYNIFLLTSIEVHKINTKLQYKENNCSFMSSGKWVFNRLKGKGTDIPWWLGNENFHRAMRARLIEKNREFYLPLFPDDEGFNNGKYFWPDMETKTFKII